MLKMSFGLATKYLIKYSSLQKKMRQVSKIFSLTYFMQRRHYSRTKDCKKLNMNAFIFRILYMAYYGLLSGSIMTDL